MSFLAIDIGSGLTKCSTGNEFFYFESLVGQQKDNKNFSFNVDPHHVIKVGDKQYMTGPAAKSYIPEGSMVVTTKSTWCTDPNQLILLYTAIAKQHPKGYKGEMIVVAGLPMARFTKYQSIHRDLFVGKHTFSTPTHDYHVEIPQENITVFPQAVGLYFSLCETQKDSDWNEGLTGLVDPGTHSTGYAVIEKGVYNNLKSADEQSVGGNIGMMKLAKSMRKELAEQYEWEPTMPELLDALRIGHVDLYGEKPQKIIMKDIAQRYVPQVYGEIINEIVAKWKGAKAIRVIISSGGGEYLADYVRKSIPHVQLLHKTRTAKDKINEAALFDVVRGYAIFGKVHFKAKLEAIEAIEGGVVTPIKHENAQKVG
jgi:hypothetical protein